MNRLITTFNQCTAPLLRVARLGKAAVRPLNEPKDGDDPLAILRSWMADGRKLALAMPDAMALATATLGAAPSVRMVLPKDVDDAGIVFYTHATSRKGMDLAQNAQAAGCFYWDTLARQVRVDGPVEPMPPQAADTYFASRPRKSQLGAWVSRQSHAMNGPEDMAQGMAERERQFAGIPVPRPPGWVGYRLVAKRVEIWQGQAFRLHDRFVFERGANGWAAKRLWP